MKQISVKDETWQILMRIKADKKMRSMDDVIMYIYKNAKGVKNG